MWRCEYCGRTNQRDEPQCDGCGAFKPITKTVFLGDGYIYRDVEMPLGIITSGRLRRSFDYANPISDSTGFGSTVLHTISRT